MVGIRGDYFGGLGTMYCVVLYDVVVCVLYNEARRLYGFIRFLYTPAKAYAKHGKVNIYPPL